MELDFSGMQQSVVNTATRASQINSQLEQVTKERRANNRWSGSKYSAKRAS